jgi:hypothetical protein
MHLGVHGTDVLNGGLAPGGSSSRRHRLWLEILLRVSVELRGTAFATEVIGRIAKYFAACSLGRVDRHPADGIFHLYSDIRAVTAVHRLLLTGLPKGTGRSHIVI